MGFSLTFFVKRDLQREFSDLHGFDTKQTLKAADKGNSLVRLYNRFADSAYLALLDKAIFQRTAA